MKYFRMSYEEVIFQRSYLNLVLLNRAIPGIKPFDKDKKGKYSHKKPSRQHANDFFEQLM